MTVQLCLAPHRDNPPRTLGGLKLCAGHHGALLDALTGPSAAEDPTIDAVWGLRHFAYVTIYESRAAAYLTAPRYYLGGEVVCGDGTAWFAPGDYRPGGIVRDWLALGLRAKTIRTGDAATYVTRSTEPGIPIDTRLAELRHHIPAVLTSWTALHAEALAVAPPPFGASVHQLVVWLARYTDWSAAADFAGDYARELGELRARARALIDLPRPRRTVVAPCIEWVDSHPCTGTLFTVAREPNDPTPVVVQCDTCPAAYDSTQWERLGRRLKRAGRTAA